MMSTVAHGLMNGRAAGAAIGRGSPLAIIMTIFTMTTPMRGASG